MRAIWIALLIVLTAACKTPYTPTPLPPIPPPVVTPPAPNPPAPAPAPFTLSLYPTPTPVETNKPTNLVLVIGGQAPREPVSIAWNFGDGTTTTTIDKTTVPHTYARAGKVTASASVVDATSRRASVDAIITINDPQPPPPTPPAPPPQQSYAVAITANPPTVQIGDPTTITAIVIPLNGAPAPTAYFWDCTNDGTFDEDTTVPTAICRYTSAGLKTVRGVASSATAAGAGTTSVLVTAMP